MALLVALLMEIRTSDSLYNFCDKNIELLGRIIISPNLIKHDAINELENNIIPIAIYFI